ncbi:nicotinate-nucleotide adenylyltransferase [bacterium SCSIO 12741]|nr:nicotinate-nucleotide adenylyltransferase [bacterium SCSIO 12741]
MKVGLYFGTYNPIHVGHLIIANHMANYTNLDQVWMVVTPRNPLKNKESLLPDYHRLEIVRRAIEDNDKLRVSDIEFKLEKPSYTAHTLAYLQDKYPGYEFALIMGEDNLRTLHKWKNYETILKNHSLVVYPRVLTEQEKTESIPPPIKPEIHQHPNVNVIQAPIMKVSASFIRRAIKEGKDVRYLLSEPVFKYVDEMNFYR